MIKERAKDGRYALVVDRPSDKETKRAIEALAAIEGIEILTLRALDASKLEYAFIYRRPLDNYLMRDPQDFQPLRLNLSSGPTFQGWDITHVGMLATESNVALFDFLNEPNAPSFFDDSHDGLIDDLKVLYETAFDPDRFVVAMLDRNIHLDPESQLHKKLITKHLIQSAVALISRKPPFNYIDDTQLEKWIGLFSSDFTAQQVTGIKKPPLDPNRRIFNLVAARRVVKYWLTTYLGDEI